MPLVGCAVEMAGSSVVTVGDVPNVVKAVCVVVIEHCGSKEPGKQRGANVVRILGTAVVTLSVDVVGISVIGCVVVPIESILVVVCEQRGSSEPR